MSLAQQLRMTAGQTYSVAITLVVAVLLLFGLGDVHGVVSTAVAEAPLPLATQGPAVAAAPGVVAVPPASPQLPIGTGGLPAPVPAPAPLPTYQDVPVPPFPTSPPPATASPTPTAGSCRVDGLQPVSDTAIETLQTANGLVGGRLPTSDIAAAVGVVTGCDPADPAVVAVGLLIGIGRALPDPGLPNPVVLPFVQIPAGVVASLQPARPLIDQACGLVGTGQTVAALFVSAYPQPVPQLVSQVLFTALSICGQVRQP
jgi:hypothetical protein